jgi:hypothetical protein
MSALKRVALSLAMLLIAANLAALLVTNFHLEGDYLVVTSGALLVTTPCWVLQLPLVFALKRFKPWQAFVFVAAGAIVAAVIIPSEAKLFFTNSPSNAMPHPPWFRVAELRSAAIATLLWSIYVMLVQSLTRAEKASALPETNYS